VLPVQYLPPIWGVKSVNWMLLLSYRWKVSNIKHIMIYKFHLNIFSTSNVLLTNHRHTRQNYFWLWAQCDQLCKDWYVSAFKNLFLQWMNK
jgi:hypothetical protein